MKKLLAFLVLLLALVVVVSFFLPREIHVERSVTIQRPASTVFAILNSYQSFNEWSPWADLDPDAEFRRSGPPTGVGARLDWSGDPAMVGTGWQEITASVPYERVETHLDFGPQGEADAYFEIRGDQLGSSVTWGFDTDVTKGQGFLGSITSRYFGLFLDAWIGKDFEKGLAGLKAYAETLPAGDLTNARVEVLEVEPIDVLMVSGSSSTQSDDIGEALGTAYGQIMQFVQKNGLTTAGQPLAIARKWDESGYEFDAAIPVINQGAESDGVVRWGQTPGGKVARIVHVGPYDTTAESYAKLEAWLALNGYEAGPLSWEHYISDPGYTPEDQIITHIYYQIAN